jgi:hypothetical protein
MADLEPAHVEAVADLVGEWLFRMHGIQSSCDHHAEAVEILTSTDPAVHAALLAALVRAGVLEEHFVLAQEDEQPDMSGKPRIQHIGEWFERSRAEAALSLGARARNRWIQRRYVTRWEDAHVD